MATSITATWAALAASSPDTSQTEKILNPRLCDKNIAIVDATALIKGLPIETKYDVIYTVKEVYEEVRDKAARQRLQNLPYKVETQEPNSDSIKTIMNFAQKTGDFDFLSTADVKLIALAFQFEKEIYGIEHLHLSPRKAVSVKSTPAGKQEELPGWGQVSNPEDWKFLDRLDESKFEEVEKQQIKATHIAQEPQSLLQSVNLDDTVQSNDQELDQSTPVQEMNEDEGWSLVSTKPKKQPKKPVKQRLPSASEGDAIVDNHNSRVNCLSGDFGIQNVLLQMGLKLVTPDAVRIHHLTRWGLKCASCFHTMKKSGKVFCPNCGNSTLFKVRIEVDENGVEVFGGMSKPQQRRGARCSIPPPKGGKNNKDAIVTEDMMHQTMQKFRNLKTSETTTDILSPDYDEDSWFKTRSIKNKIKDQLPGRFGYPQFMAKYTPHRRKR